MRPSVDFLSCNLFYFLGRFILRFFSQAFVREVWVFFHPARLFPAIVVGRRFKGCVSWVEKNRVCRPKRHLFFSAMTLSEALARSLFLRLVIHRRLQEGLREGLRSACKTLSRSTLVFPVRCQCVLVCGTANVDFCTYPVCFRGTASFRFVV